MLAVLATPGWPQSSGGDFEITRSVIAAGGGNSSGGGFSLQGTLGQPQASSAAGGDFALRAGFVLAREVRDLPEIVFLSGFEDQEVL